LFNAAAISVIHKTVGSERRQRLVMIAYEEAVMCADLLYLPEALTRLRYGLFLVKMIVRGGGFCIGHSIDLGLCMR
jgi:hypothetical protein